MSNKFLLSALSFLALSTAATAGDITVINKNKKELDIKIEADGDSNATIKHTIPASDNSNFKVNADQLNGKMFFSIKGDTSSFTPGSTCDNLHVDKDYQLTFTNDKVGTTCRFTEMTAAMKAKMAADTGMNSTDMTKSHDDMAVDNKAGKM